MATAAAEKSALQLMKDYFLDFKVLKEVPREYWGVQFVNFADSVSYFALTMIVTIFLSKEIGLSDTTAGYVWTGVSAVITLFLMAVAGVLTDYLGIRRSIKLAMWSKAAVMAGIAAFAWVPAYTGVQFPEWIRISVISLLFILLAPSVAMLQTLYQVANKRYTTKKARSAGFNLWYLFMNVGAFVAGLGIDLFRLTFGWSNTTIIAAGIVTSLVSLVATSLWIRSDAQVFGADEAKEEEKKESGPKKSPFAVYREIARHTAFWRFLVLLVALLGVRAVFLLMMLVMPKYWMRVIGPDVALGTLNAINPALIIVGLIVFIPIANKFDVFKQLVFGAMISALSLFVLVLPWKWFSPDVATAYFTMAVVSQVVLSIGELFWSPKLYEYTVAIAPEGQEGAYTGFSAMPWFFAKFVVSAMSGHMLGRWSPEGIGEKIRAGTVAFWDSPEAMWLLLGIWAMSGPFIALFFEKWLTEGARFRQKKEEPAAADATAA